MILNESFVAVDNPNPGFSPFSGLRQTSNPFIGVFALFCWDHDFSAEFAVNASATNETTRSQSCGPGHPWVNPSIAHIQDHLIT
jgi:hypothetical protein